VLGILAARQRQSKRLNKKINPTNADGFGLWVSGKSNREFHQKPSEQGITGLLGPRGAG
jgi:hypothetical protein